MARSIIRWTALALVLVLLLAACGQPGDDRSAADGASPAPRSSPADTPRGDDPTECGEKTSGDVVSYQPCPGAGSGDGGPQQVEPTPGQVDVRAVPWDRAEASGTKVRVYFWSGVEPCYVLDRVDVVEAPRTVTITLYEGRTETEEDIACIELAVRKFTVVTLDEPAGQRKIVDGSGRG